MVQEMRKEEKTLAQIAAEYEVHPTQLKRWRTIALEGLPTLFEEHDDTAALKATFAEQQAALYAEIGRLTTQVTWLKKKLESTLERRHRIALVDWDHATLPHTVQAELLRVSRASRYYRPRPPSEEEIALKHRIDELYTQYPFYGSRRITAQLQREGKTVNRKAGQGHMREMGIAGISPGPQVSRRNTEDIVYPYLLRGMTLTSKSGQALRITLINLCGGWNMRLCVMA